MHELLHTFDDRVTAWVRSWPAWMYRPMLAITNVGQPLTIILFAVGLLVWSWWHDKTLLAVASAIVLVTVIVSSALKLVLRRARPDTEYAANMVFRSYSFPSGHAAAATIGFGFIAYLTFLGLAAPWSIILGVAVILFGLLVGISRIYLGAHYPSDVIGGMLLGLVGIVIILFIVRPLS